MQTVRIFTAFSGYDSQCLALERLGIPYELVGWSEIDPFAIRAHNALFPRCAARNYGDIARIDWGQVPDFDLLTYSFPCTDISVAGRQRGLAESSGTASSLLWYCHRAIEAKRPRYLLMENVKALLSYKFRPHFQEWERTVARMGYTNFVKVLNARDYGVPQNRERVFMVSILGDASYHFPAPVPLTRRLADVMEADVPQKYFLSDRMLHCLLQSNLRNTALGNGFRFSPKTDGDIANTITTAAGSRLCDNYLLSYTRDSRGKVIRRTTKDIANTVHTSTGSSGNTDSLVVCIAERIREIAEASRRQPCGVTVTTDKRIYPHLLDKARSTVEELVVDSECGVAGTLRSSKPGKVYGESTGFAIRRLTPRECFRLMGVADADIDRIQEEGISDTQQYRMAGNSIVVDVLCHIFRKLFIDPDNENQQLTLF